MFVSPQSILGAEGISLQLRHISAHLLWVCGSQDAVHPKLRDVLHRVIRVLGYFTARNHDNQVRFVHSFTHSHARLIISLCALPRLPPLWVRSRCVRAVGGGSPGVRGCVLQKDCPSASLSLLAAMAALAACPATSAVLDFEAALSAIHVLCWPALCSGPFGLPR